MDGQDIIAYCRVEGLADGVMECQYANSNKHRSTIEDRADQRAEEEHNRNQRRADPMIIMNTGV